MDKFIGDHIESIQSVKPHIDAKLIIFHLKTCDDKYPTLVVGLKTYCKWLKNNKNNYNNIFMDFVKEFLNNSDLDNQPIEEIVDKYGNLYPDDDKPINWSRMVGSSNQDLDRTIYQTMPRPSMFYTGNLGIGYIAW